MFAIAKNHFVMVQMEKRKSGTRKSKDASRFYTGCARRSLMERKRRGKTVKVQGTDRNRTQWLYG